MTYRIVACAYCDTTKENMYMFEIADTKTKKLVGYMYLCEKHRHLGASMRPELSLVPIKPKEDTSCHTSQSSTPSQPDPTPSIPPTHLEEDTKSENKSS